MEQEVKKRRNTLKPRFTKRKLCLFTAEQEEAIHKRAEIEGKGAAEIIRDSVDAYLFGTANTRYNPDARP